MQYPKEKELNARSIEKWAEELDRQPKRELTSEEIETFISAKWTEKAMEADKDGAFADLLNRWNGVAILHRRLQLHTFTMTNAVQLCLGSMVQSPGEAVMMLNYIQFRCHLHHIRHVDITTLSERIMPMGWFDRDLLREFWEKQKYVASDGSLKNMLDCTGFGESIRNLE